MLTKVNPKLPMRNKAVTVDFYVHKLGFSPLGNTDFDQYLMVTKDDIELHFFEHKTLNPAENYGQVYIRTTGIQQVYADFLAREIPIHPNGPLQLKPWGQWEFSVLDPDNNLLTFGEAME